MHAVHIRARSFWNVWTVFRSHCSGWTRDSVEFYMLLFPFKRLTIGMEFLHRNESFEDSILEFASLLRWVLGFMNFKFSIIFQRISERVSCSLVSFNNSLIVIVKYFDKFSKRWIRYVEYVKEDFAGLLAVPYELLALLLPPKYYKNLLNLLVGWLRWVITGLLATGLLPGLRSSNCSKLITAEVLSL